MFGILSQSAFPQSLWDELNARGAGMVVPQPSQFATGGSLDDPATLPGMLNQRSMPSLAAGPMKMDPGVVPLGLLSRQQTPPMQPDAPAPMAVEAGPQPQPGAPMQLPSANGGPAAPQQPQGGLLSGIDNFIGKLGNIYGNGGGGDGLINLGLAIASPGNMAQNLAKANETNNRSRLVNAQLAQTQQKQAALNQTAKMFSERLGIPMEQAAALASSPANGRVLAQMFAQKNTGAAEYGLNPQYGVDASGNPVLIQLGKDGKAVQSQLPGGVSLSKEPIKLDAGTEYVLLDPITRQPVGRIPKNVAEVQRQEVLGKNQGEREVSAGSDIAQADVALDTIKQIREHKGKTSAIGWRSALPTVPGSDAYGFEQLVEQARSGAFLTAIEQLRGMGALSNAEGETAKNAITRLKIGLGGEDFEKALSDYEKIVQAGKQRAMANRRTPGGASPQQPLSDPLGIR
jgi:hypothetical protein